MATIQKTTLKRYNGTDWDPIYLAGSSDLIYLSAQHTVASGDGWTVGQEIAANTPSENLIVQIIDNLTKLDKVTVPALAAGTGITSVDASKITGVINRENLPTDVGGKGVEVDDEDGKDALTSDDVNVGDIVKVTGGKVYLVTATTPAVTYMELSDTASEVAWSRITGTPTTVAGYGITDALTDDDVAAAANADNAGKFLALDVNGKLPASITGDAATLGGQAPAYYATEADLTAAEGEIDTLQGQVGTAPAGDDQPGTGLLGDVAQLKTEMKAQDASWITSGTIDVARLPQAALERLYVAANDEARLALTTAEVQNGDVVKVTETGLMYYVKDDTKLGGDTPEEAFEPFTAGAASSVPWSGVTSKPTTLTGYGITDAVAASEKHATYAEGGVVIFQTGNTSGRTYEINAKAKAAADADMAADASKLNGQSADYYATAADMTTVKEYIEDLQDGTVTNLTVPAEKISGVLADTQLPDSVKFALVEVADQTGRFALTTTQVQNGDVVKQTDTGALYFVKDATNLNNAAGYEQIAAVSMSWNKITGKPTTLDGYGITDAVKSSEKAATYTEGSVVVYAQGTNNTTSTNYEINAKANTACLADRATMAADAEKLGGQLPAYYAKQSDMATAQGNIATIQGQIGTATAGDVPGTGILKDIEDLKAGTAITAIAAEKITGVLDIANIPASVVERLSIVENDEARLALTSEQVQNGDSVKVVDTGLMYFVKDDTKLGSPDTAAQAFEVYTVGSAASVPWSGVTEKPTTLSGYGITDAVNTNEKVTEATAGNAGKILVLNAEGKLDADITGHVEWDNILNKPTSTAQQIDDAVTAATHTNRTVLDKFAEADGKLTYGGAEVAMASTVTALSTTVSEHTNKITQLGLGCLTVVDDVTTAFPSAAEGQMALETI